MNVPHLFGRVAIAAGILLGAMGGIAAAGSAARVNPGRALRL